MAVGGVVSIEEKWDRAKINKFSNMLRTKIMNERENVRVSPVGSFVNAVGEDAALAIWQEYERNGVISQKHIDLMAQKMPRNRFIAFAKMENNAVTESSRYQEPRTEEDSKGRKKEVRGKTIVSATRDVSFSINIYDLKAKNSAFSGSLSNSSSRSTEYLDPEENNSLMAGVADVIRAAKGTENQQKTQHKAPPPPKEEEVSEYIFSGFAKNFPEAD